MTNSDPPDRVVAVQYACGHIDHRFALPNSLSNRAAVLLPVVLREFPCRECAGPEDADLFRDPRRLLKQFDDFRQGRP